MLHGDNNMTRLQMIFPTKMSFFVHKKIKKIVNNPGFCNFLPSQYEDFIATFDVISLLYSCGFVAKSVQSL